MIANNEIEINSKSANTCVSAFTIGEKLGSSEGKPCPWSVWANQCSK